MSLNEAIVEDTTLSWFSELGYSVGHGPKIAPGEPDAERSSFGDVVLVRRLQDAIERLNPLIPHQGQDSRDRETHSEQMGVSSGPAGRGREDSPAAGGTVVRRLDGSTCIGEGSGPVIDTTPGLNLDRNHARHRPCAERSARPH